MKGSRLYMYSIALCGRAGPGFYTRKKKSNLVWQCSCRYLIVCYSKAACLEKPLPGDFCLFLHKPTHCLHCDKTLFPTPQPACFPSLHALPFSQSNRPVRPDRSFRHHMKHCRRAQVRMLILKITACCLLNRPVQFNLCSYLQTPDLISQLLLLTRAVGLTPPLMRGLRSIAISRLTSAVCSNPIHSLLLVPEGVTCTGSRITRLPNLVTDLHMAIFLLGDPFPPDLWGRLLKSVYKKKRCRWQIQLHGRQAAYIPRNSISTTEQRIALK